MMTSEMHDGAGWMMGGMGLLALLVMVFLVAGIFYFVRNSRGR
jgi:hypothetical protein